MAACSCTEAYGNTGRAYDCKAVFGIARNVWLVPKFDSSSVQNHILNSATLNQAYFIGKFNADNRLDRIYPINDVKEFDSTKADSKVFEHSDGTKQFLAEGVRSFAYTISDVEYKYIAKLRKSGCNQFGVYLQDADGNIIGNGRQSDRLLPLMVEIGSLDVKAMWATDAPQTSGVTVTFDLARTELDQDLAVITADQFASDVDFEAFGLQGVLDLEATFSNISTTSADANITLNYGSHNSKVLFTSGVQVDFTLYNVTDAAAVTITGMDVTDAANGNYTGITYALQDSADVMELRIDPTTKNGYEMNQQFTIP